MAGDDRTEAARDVLPDVGGPPDRARPGARRFHRPRGHGQAAAPAVGGRRRLRVGRPEGPPRGHQHRGHAAAGPGAAARARRAARAGGGAAVRGGGAGAGRGLQRPRGGLLAAAAGEPLVAGPRPGRRGLAGRRVAGDPSTGAASGTRAAACAGPPPLVPPRAPRSCEAGGGAFSRDHGVKSCTTTTQTQQTIPVVRSISTGAGSTLTAVGSRTDVLALTTTQTQKGNGEVTTDQSATVLSSSVTAISCTWEVFGIRMQYPNSYCEQNGLVCTPTPLGPVA